jgi:NADH-ubiquinone oxidoreductase chain 2
MIIITILTFIVAISLQNKQTSISPILFARLASIFLIYSAFLSLNVLYIETLGSGIGIYSGFYQVTTISQSIEIFLYITGAFILMPWYPYLQYTTVSARLNSLRTDGVIELTNSLFPKFHSPLLSEYSLILLFTTLGGSLLISSSDLVSMYLSIELQSFAVYLLATIYRDSESATSAGLKYFLLGGLSSCFILLGAGLLYSYTGLTNLESIYSLISVPSSYVSGFSISDYSLSTLSIPSENLISSSIGSGGYLLGLTLIIVGFLFKIAAAPFHN